MSQLSGLKPIDCVLRGDGKVQRGHLLLEHERELDLVAALALGDALGAHTLQVGLVDRLEADGTLAPRVLAQRQIVKYARPAVDVAALGHLRRTRLVQADGTRERRARANRHLLD